MLGFLQICFILLVLSTGFCDELPDDMNHAYIRFNATELEVEVKMRSTNCHHCPFNDFVTIDHTQSGYKKVFMEYPLEFKLVSNGTESAVQTISLQEYGIYTLVVDGVDNPMKVVVDKKGHNYYVPFYFCLYLTIGFICLVIAIQSCKKSRPSQDSESKPLLPVVKSRIASVDVFRGMDLCLMIFANYGAGQYWAKLIHATWDGITLSDFAFPLFIFIQGISLRLSINSSMKHYLQETTPFKAVLLCTWKCLKRAVILFCLTWLINQSTSFNTIRYLGVLAYFSVSGFVNALNLLYTPAWNKKVGIISRWRAHKEFKDDENTWYFFDWIIPTLCAFLHWYVAMFVAAPNCPVGYSGPGGISDDGKYYGCTGGIYRYIDEKILGEEHMYHGAAVVSVYNGQFFECEGFLGMLNAIFMTYLGTLISWIFMNIKKPWKAVCTYLTVGTMLLLIGGILCGFKQFDGYMPINKNKWNTTFVCITSGTGFIAFGIIYWLVDVLKVWSGYPYRAVGMNSILIYLVHEFVHGYIPFTYSFENDNHWTAMANSYLLGVGMWIVIANFLYRQGAFVKI